MNLKCTGFESGVLAEEFCCNVLIKTQGLLRPYIVFKDFPSPGILENAQFFQGLSRPCGHPVLSVLSA